MQNCCLTGLREQAITISTICLLLSSEYLLKIKMKLLHLLYYRGNNHQELVHFVVFLPFQQLYLQNCRKEIQLKGKMQNRAMRRWLQEAMLDFEGRLGRGEGNDLDCSFHFTPDQGFPVWQGNYWLRLPLLESWRECLGISEL